MFFRYDCFTDSSMIRLVHHKKQRKVWHLILAILVAGMPLGMWTPCACCDATEAAAGELSGSCCASVKSCCQTAPTTSCCKTRSTPCSAADPCCCRDTPRRQPLTSDVRDDFPVRQPMPVVMDASPESLKCSEQQPGPQASELSRIPSLRLHAVLGIWLN